MTKIIFKIIQNGIKFPVKQGICGALAFYVRMLLSLTSGNKPVFFAERGTLQSRYTTTAPAVSATNPALARVAHRQGAHVGRGDNLLGRFRTLFLQKIGAFAYATMRAENAVQCVPHQACCNPRT